MSHFVSHLSQLGRRLPGLAMGLVASALLGCVPSSGGGECHADEDCFGSVCSRDGECALASELISVRLSWNLCAAPATAERCDDADVVGLRVTFLDVEGGGDISYEPVLCELGQIYFDRMSPRYDWFDAALVSRSGQLIDSGRFPLDARDNVFAMDFEPQGPTDPSWCAMLRAP